MDPQKFRDVILQGDPPVYFQLSTRTPEKQIGRLDCNPDGVRPFLGLLTPDRRATAASTLGDEASISDPSVLEVVADVACVWLSSMCSAYPGQRVRIRVRAVGSSSAIIDEVLEAPLQTSLVPQTPQSTPAAPTFDHQRLTGQLVRADKERDVLLAEFRTLARLRGDVAEQNQASTKKLVDDLFSAFDRALGWRDRELERRDKRIEALEKQLDELYTLLLKTGAENANSRHEVEKSEVYAREIGSSTRTFMQLAGKGLALYALKDNMTPEMLGAMEGLFAGGPELLDLMADPDIQEAFNDPATKALLRDPEQRSLLFKLLKERAAAQRPAA